MAYYDGERILADADTVDVAEYIGLDVIHRGKNNLIKCPGHLKRLHREDNNFGSCILTDHGYTCFACGTSVSLLDMVCEVKSCNKNEAYGIIADSLGGRDQYVISGNVDTSNIERHKILHNEDLELLNISPIIRYDEIGFIDNSKSYIKDCGYFVQYDQFNMRASYFLATKSHSISLKTLLNEAPEIYYTLIKNKAYEAMKKYQNCMDNVQSFKKYVSLDESVLYNLKIKFKTMYQRCKEIYEEIEDSKCISEKVKKETEEDLIPDYDLFD